uniref:Interleukin-18 n=1 Tax=Mastacembelus armatus TaxID=205130 RepID=A0A3Q3KUJ1_9TELE
MATIEFSPVRFYGACSDAFYFDSKMDQADLDSDTFRISIQCFKYLIRNRDNKFLLLHNKRQFQVQDLTTQQQCHADCKFNIQIYQNSALENRKGRAVMLYANKDGQKMVACCSEKHEIYPLAMDLPDTIDETAHKSLFYLIKLSASDQYMFESSMYPSKFLGFEPVEGNPSLNRLVLQECRYDEVDEHCQVILSPCME